MATTPSNSNGGSATDTIMRSFLPGGFAAAPLSLDGGLHHRRTHFPSQEKHILGNAPPSAHKKVSKSKISPPIGEFFINFLLQLVALGAAIAFGIYAVKSVTVGSIANQQAVIANQIAIL